MRIITEKAIELACRKHPKATAGPNRWLTMAKNARWPSIAEVRLVFSDADPVMVKSGKTVTVFNICRNDYRLITALHYNTGLAFVLRFLTHAEYSKDTWKASL
ncbi:MAG TPA: type II toxin-antitoxin system HigB family toxin [Tepidisphaeraceae bacterium]|jgi:mRNA interferase HigB